MRTISRGIDLSPLEPWYVTGFVERDGCFTYSRSGRQIGLHFAIKLPARDRPLLDAIQLFFDQVGRIYPAGSSTNYYRVSHRVQLHRIVTHFDNYPLRGAKADSYAIWREMVLLRRHHFRESTRERIETLARALSATSPRVRAPPGLRST